jgi:hypothetical protein
LQDLELEISHQLADAQRQLILNYELTQTNFNRTLAADQQVDAVQAAFDVATVTLDQLLEAQRRRAESQVSFFRTLLDYQRAIITMHYRKGSLLEYNNVYLQEGPWPDKAHFDAHRLARQRDAGVYMNYGFTRPSVVSEGPIRQNREGLPPGPGAPGLLHDGGMPADGALPEELPTPEAEQSLPAPASYEAAMHRRTADEPLAPAQPLVKHFEWGPLGLKSDDAGAKDDTWSRIVGESDAAAQPTRSALKQPAPGRAKNEAQPASATQGTRRDDSVRRVNHQQSQQSKPSRGEPRANQAHRAGAGAAAVRQGS